ncbi:thioesterase family protein [Microbacterium elymi]|uniref:Thioesterase family protein n=1 Tax=Microbacterium elymi TaxID=2909587 RepID=A0ABY5NNF4_9MICO|nr:acyl-CoA thioesterase domain-containing protein [Microbacterium elymi]UUT36717.1 thioesterase family protein [Microbacterium elymi]
MDRTTSRATPPPCAPTRCRTGSSPRARWMSGTSRHRSTCRSTARRKPHQAVWMRTRKRLADDPALHRAILGYLSDMTIQESILRAHGVSWSTPGLKLASLDHAMWWHRDGRVDEWMLYVQESPSAQAGRGLAQGRIYTEDGVLLASVAQEVMVRLPAPR